MFVGLIGMLASGDAIAQNIQAIATIGVTAGFSGRRRIGIYADGQFLFTPLALPIVPEGRVLWRFAYTPADRATMTVGGGVGVVAAHYGTQGPQGEYLPIAAVDVALGHQFRAGRDSAWFGASATVTPLAQFRVSAPLRPVVPRPPEDSGFPDPGPSLALDIGAGIPLIPVNFVVYGRPVRDGNAFARARGFAQHAGGAAFVAEGLEEHAAVLAFRRLAIELHALGAPGALVGRAIAAAREEAVHAALCFGLAAREGSGDIVVAPMIASLRGGDRRVRLERLRAESIVDGEINEGVASVRAYDRASKARDPVVAEVQARIGREEAAHSVLGRDVARWCQSAMT